jgi:hypothetical protein
MIVGGRMAATRRRVSILWQNWLMALSFVPLLGVGSAVLFVKVTPAPDGVWLALLGFLAQVCWYAVGIWAMVRTVRLGAYWTSDGRMKIRSLLRSWTIRPDQINAILVFEAVGNWGRKFYFPVLVIDGRDKNIGLWWLSAMKEPKARGYAVRVRELMTAANGNAPTAEGEGPA